MIGKYPRNNIRSKHDSTPAIFVACFAQNACILASVPNLHPQGMAIRTTRGRFLQTWLRPKRRGRNFSPPGRTMSIAQYGRYVSSDACRLQRGTKAKSAAGPRREPFSPRYRQKGCVRAWPTKQARTDAARYQARLPKLAERNVAASGADRRRRLFRTMTAAAAPSVRTVCHEGRPRHAGRDVRESAR